MARNVVFWSIALGILLLDRFTKLLVLKFIPLTSSIDLFPYVSLTHITNTGALFGVFKSAQIVFAVLAVVVCAYIVWKYRTFKEWYVVPSAFIFAGALGNLIDRLLYSGVIDFISVGIWPVFNVADSAISVAVVWLLIVEYVHAERKI
jgi:signal peptidase II